MQAYYTSVVGGTTIVTTSETQWAPTLEVHDPNPAINLSSPSWLPNPVIQQQPTAHYLPTLVIV